MNQINNTFPNTAKLVFAVILLGLIFSLSANAVDGTSIWTNRSGGGLNSSSAAHSLALDENGNVYVTGEMYGSTSLDFGTIKYSSGGFPMWTNLYDGPGHGADKAYSLVLDESNNVYVTGQSYGGSTGDDYATIKYSSAGLPLWTNRFNGAGSAYDSARFLMVDTNDNVYVTGNTAGFGNIDYGTIKYSGAGVPLWTNRFNGADNRDDYAQTLALDSNGDVYVAGYSYHSDGFCDWVTIKYSSAGVPLWTNFFSDVGNLDDQPTSIAVDDVGGVYVAGYGRGNGGNTDYVTIKYSSAGLPLWTNIFNGAGGSSDEANAIALDAARNVYVTGDSFENGSIDYVTIKYSSTGDPLWTNQFNGIGNGSDFAHALALDINGNVYVTGESFGGTSARDIATIKYSSAGIPLWTNILNGPGNGYDGGNALAADRSGNVYVTGFSSGGGSGNDYVTIKYSGPPATPFSFSTSNDSLGFINSQFRLTLTGPADSNAVISASTNLQTWIPLVTNPLFSGSLSFTDTLATNYTHRFYRANLQ